MDITIWTTEGKQSVAIDDVISITANKTDFIAECRNAVSGELNLDTLDSILDFRPEIVDEKALELKKTRDILKALYKH
jgi:hypothetical protein